MSGKLGEFDFKFCVGTLFRPKTPKNQQIKRPKPNLIVVCKLFWGAPPILTSKGQPLCSK